MVRSRGPGLVAGLWSSMLNLLSVRLDVVILESFKMSLIMKDAVAVVGGVFDDVCLVGGGLCWPLGGDAEPSLLLIPYWTLISALLDFDDIIPSTVMFSEVVCFGLSRQIVV